MYTSLLGLGGAAPTPVKGHVPQGKGGIALLFWLPWSTIFTVLVFLYSGWQFYKVAYRCIPPPFRGNCDCHVAVDNLILCEESFLLGTKVVSMLRKSVLRQHFEMKLVNFLILSKKIILDNLGIKFIKVLYIYLNTVVFEMKHLMFIKLHTTYTEF